MAVTRFLLFVLLAPNVWGDDALWQALKTEPNLVVFMRHAQPAGGDPLKWDQSGNCEGESMLTLDGKAHAKRIGDAFSARGIKPIVISSPMCRCRDTAEIAFGHGGVTDGELREVASADSARMKSFEGRAVELITTHRGSMPVVFVSHRPNIDLLTMELIESGDLLVARVNKNGEVLVVGKIRVP